MMPQLKPIRQGISLVVDCLIFYIMNHTLSCSHAILTPLIPHRLDSYHLIRQCLSYSPHTPTSLSACHPNLHQDKSTIHPLTSQCCFYGNCTFPGNKHPTLGPKPVCHQASTTHFSITILIMMTMLFLYSWIPYSQGASVYCKTRIFHWMTL